MRTGTVLTLYILILCCTASAAQGETFARRVTDATKPAFIGGLAIACLASKEHGLHDAIQAGDAMLLSYGIAHALQSTWVVNGEPDFRHTFPSKRAAVAFAAATSLSDVYPKQKWIAYTGASLIGWSTVAVNGHKWTDVIGGAALGIVAGKWAVASPDGLIVGRVLKF
ncbi:MAG: phosphatase PAP2 family protein [Armatimonadota bacterium]